MIKVTDEQYKIIIDILKKFVPYCEVRAFGSRYKGTPKDYSDLDLAVVGEEKLDWHVLANLKYAFEESDLPYRVDVLDWYATSSEFRKVIEKGYEVVCESTDGEREERFQTALNKVNLNHGETLRKLGE